MFCLPLPWALPKAGIKRAVDAGAEEDEIKWIPSDCRAGSTRLFYRFGGAPWDLSVRGGRDGVRRGGLQDLQRAGSAESGGCKTYREVIPTEPVGCKTYRGLIPPNQGFVRVAEGRF